MSEATGPIAVGESGPPTAVEGASGWQIRVLYDGECPLCAREIAMLRRLDRGRGAISLEDLSAPDFDAGVYGLDQRAIEARIHGVLPDGRVVEGVEVFLRAYRAVGLGWLVAPATWPGLRRLVEYAYRVFARNRLRWTGRSRRAGGDPECNERCRLE